MKKLRQLKVESLLKREIATLILMEVKNPKVKFVTVTGVSLSNDLRRAHVYVSVMGDEATKKRALKGLKDTSGFIRSKVGDVINLRYNPEIIFEIDRSIDEHARVDSLLQQIETEKSGGEKKDE
jgi:ribosome-binding factor A